VLLNSIEYWTVNNPLRGLIQRHYEAPRLKRISGGAAHRVLEIGCGQGTGARIIYDLFEPRHYVGLDLDSRMVQRARRKARALPNARFLEGDVASLAFPDGSFDLVVDFGVVHHVPNWQDALAEIHRVLKSGGEFLFEDLSLDTFESGVGIPVRRLLDHPYDQMFRKQEFVDGLESLGFTVESHDARPLGFRHFWGRAVK
jgi:ubiquinone/menaquinone biosynthesis C-methylase UbiE